MNYPVWYIPSIGGAIIIAVVAIVHVLISHFAVGGGLWLVLTEKKAYREGKEFMIEYVRRHALFFMLLTMVLGSMTGVGIWLTISLISPDATSTLIHYFVFGWAIEWVFFVIEIVTAFLYYYTFGKISEKLHLLIGWIYFIAAWASLWVINGIISFMLTPGRWLETGNFWHGLFNPTFLPATLFRTFLSFGLAGSYALLTASKRYRGEERRVLARYNGKWIGVSLLGMIPALAWYYLSLPELTKQGLAGASPIMRISLIHLAGGILIFVLLLFLFVLWKSEKLSFARSLIVLLSIFIFFGAFEYIREAGRKPYIINGYMLVNGLRCSQLEQFRGQSVLKRARWVIHDEINEENKAEAGGEIFRIQCYACHTLGFKNNITRNLRNWKESRIVNIVGSLGKISPYMPDFIGTEAERAALGYWLFRTGRGSAADLAVEPAKADISGEKLFSDYCAVCHERDEADPVWAYMKTLNSPDEVYDMLGRLNELNEDMPPFEGSDAERLALADYLMFFSRQR